MPTDNQGSFARHHAVVTGGGRGIGAAIADALASRGAAVSLIDLNVAALDATAARLTRDYGAKVATASADVADQAAVHAAMASLKDRLGSPTILVNNAGIAPSAPFLKADAALWRKVLDIDLMGCVYCSQAALPDMLQAGWGRIVNIASTAGITGLAYVTTYCAAKHAVIGLTRALAIETARSAVTVNAICPGYAATDLVDEAVSGITAKTGRGRDDVLAGLVARNPQGRLIKPEEVADTVVWLCSAGAGSVTGQSIVLAGGELMP